MKLKIVSVAILLGVSSAATAATENTYNPQEAGFSVHAGYSGMTGEFSDRVSDSNAYNIDLAYTFDNGVFIGGRFAPDIIKGTFVRADDKPVAPPVTPDPEPETEARNGKEASLSSIESDGYGAFVGYQDISGFRTSLGLMFIDTKINEQKDSSLGYIASVGYLVNNISIDVNATYVNLGDFAKSAFNDGTSEGVSLGLNLGYKF